MKRIESKSTGVIIYEKAPVYRSADQNARYLLQISGMPRDQPSLIIRVFVNEAVVSHESSTDLPSFAAEYMTYNSPVPDGPVLAATPGSPLPIDQGESEILIDISNAIMKLTPFPYTVDVSLVIVDLENNPVDVSTFRFSTFAILNE